MRVVLLCLVFSLGTPTALGRLLLLSLLGLSLLGGILCDAVGWYYYGFLRVSERFLGLWHLGGGPLQDLLTVVY